VNAEWALVIVGLGVPLVNVVTSYLIGQNLFGWRIEQLEKARGETDTKLDDMNVLLIRLAERWNVRVDNAKERTP